MIYYKIYIIISYYLEDELKKSIGDLLVDIEFNSPEECALYLEINKEKYKWYEEFVFIPSYKFKLNDQTLQLPQSEQTYSQQEIQFMSRGES